MTLVRHVTQYITTGLFSFFETVFSDRLHVKYIHWIPVDQMLILGD